MVGRRMGVLAACCGLCVGPSSAIDTAVALVQSAVQMHEERILNTEYVELLGEEEAEEVAAKPPPLKDLKGLPVEWVVTNDFLKHTGPGVKWRRSAQLNDTIGSKLYAPWGVHIIAAKVDSDWVQVGDRFLPTKIGDAPVLVLQEPHARAEMVYHKTKVQTAPDQWIAAEIVSVGASPYTYDVMVKPGDLPDYKLQGVQASKLENIIMERRFPRTAPVVASLASKPTPVPDESSFIKVKVQFEKTIINMQFMRRSPFKAMMLMSCSRANIDASKCMSSAFWVYKSQVLTSTDKAEDVALIDSDIVYMFKGSPPAGASLAKKHV